MQETVQAAVAKVLGRSLGRDEALMTAGLDSLGRLSVSLGRGVCRIEVQHELSCSKNRLTLQVHLINHC